MENSLSKKIEAILYFKGEPVSRKKLSEILSVGQLEINEAIDQLKISLEGRGVVLQEKENPARNASGIADAGGDIQLGTSPEWGDIIEALQKEELNKDLTKASLETLSIVLYKNGASRPLIDYIRGVNSSFTLRALSVRGLVERHIDPYDSRRYIYKPTFELLSYMGVGRVEDLPEYEKVNTSINVAEQEEKNATEESEKETSDDAK